MSRSKTGTPVIEDHPAHRLKFVDEEIKAQLLKTPTHLVLEQETYQTQLKEMRNDWRYAFVVQWLTYFRGAIRMANDPLTIDLIEEELVGFTEENLLPKIATNMAAVLLGTKVTMEDFSFRARFLLGDLTTVLGTEDEPVEYQSLSFVDKFEVLYLLITFLQYNDIFRKQVEKYDRQQELRFDPIFEDDKESYYLLSDNRIYKRSLLNFPEIKIPRKFKYAKSLDPEVDFAEIEPEVGWECIAIGIYQIHDFLESIKGKVHYRPLFKNIKEHINDLASEDLVTRKKILKRKREQQLHDLVSHRKRSSRLQEKEEHMKIEKQRQEEEAERQREVIAKAKAQKRYRQKLKQLELEAEERIRRQTTSRRAALLEEYKPSSTENIELDEGDWLFDCYCGVREKNYDDGVKMLKCERCNRWQHLKCQDRTVRQELVKNSNEVFICLWCHEEIEREAAKRLEEERMQREKEAEEKLKQMELQKQKEDEEKARLSAERERRLLERAKTHELSRSPSIERLTEKSFSSGTTPLPQQQQHQPQQPIQQYHHQQLPIPRVSSASDSGPSMGTFHAIPPPFQPQFQPRFPHHQQPHLQFPHQQPQMQPFAMIQPQQQNIPAPFGYAQNPQQQQQQSPQQQPQPGFNMPIAQSQPIPQQNGHQNGHPNGSSSYPNTLHRS